MMMRILEAGGLPPLTDGIRTADRDNPNGYYEFEPVKQTARDASWLAQAEGRAVKLVYLLLRDLPRDRPYRVVFMHRRRIHVGVSHQQPALSRRPTRIGASGPRDHRGADWVITCPLGEGKRFGGQRHSQERRPFFQSTGKLPANQ